MVTLYLKDTREGPAINAIYVDGVHINLVVEYNLNAAELVRLAKSDEVFLNMKEES